VLLLSEGEPIIQFPRSSKERGTTYQRTGALQQIAFDRKELNLILNLYGRYVASGEWRDYAMDFDTELATFSIFRRASEQPLYRIVKNPALARKQGVYAVVAQGGLILKRGHDLAQVLSVLVKRPRLATS
jgi:glycogen debranching enzyme